MTVLEAQDLALAWRTDAPEGTARLGRALGRLARPGDLLCLTGELGSGKTVLVRAIAEGMGIDPAEVHSPTFALIHEYRGEVPLYHMDWYRLDDAAALETVGLEEYLRREGVTVIEWAEKAEGSLPRDRLLVRLLVEGPMARTFVVEAGGDRSRMLLRDLAAAVPPASLADPIVRTQ